MIFSETKYSLIKEKTLFGRYITNQHIEPLLNDLPKEVIVTKLGTSADNRSIFGLKLGQGKIKIMMWSQMHGNESTTTKATFDLINYLISSKELLKYFNFLIIPILNPDGAHFYTRFNANQVDLNRDAQDRSQPETKVLFEAFHQFKPDYCLNLHGQRTIYAAGEMGKSATLSFLAPASNTDRSIPSNRKTAMHLIYGIYEDLKGYLPGSIGLYADAFNLNCTGDTFQSLGVPTILFEAGHFPEDYDREKTRYYVFLSYISLLKRIQKLAIVDETGYWNIPLNAKSYLDVIIRNVQTRDAKIVDVGLLFEEILDKGTISFIPKVETIGKLTGYLGHNELDAKAEIIEFSKKNPIKEGDEIDFVVIKNEKILIKP
ncbi:M14 family zinc carboxypeptidase [Winogradskyella aurantiaca]|uniref:M14 family zinc carboxypeptidase n=1 Tax=Winogradskyella aurantiaca TaxID=2219558 RepID=UPI000E1E01D5|nr:M14 family zinc carboxypeptidase [Winogradskyella aurantiaca]